MKLEEAVEIVLVAARWGMVVPSNFLDKHDSIKEATDIVEDFFMNSVWEEKEYDEIRKGS